jgi:alkylation response protein AidB-like acyl-CoA dehydrogenase
MRGERQKTLDAVRALLPEMQRDAARLDEAAAFPEAIFVKLRALGLLTATLPASLGGQNFGEGTEGALALLALFQLLGEGSLAVARLYEAHVNALQLVLRYGPASLASCCARDASDGALFALWVTDPPSGGLALNGHTLTGQKAFCSGAGAAGRALVTVATPEGTRMAIISLQDGVKILPHDIKLAGMRAATTAAADFTGLTIPPDALFGDPGDYLREPVFSAGAWRGAAAALGGLTALVKLHRDTILHRHRETDPHQQARFGQLVIQHETARLWMRNAAVRGCLEDDGNEAIVAYINLARLAVEEACLTAITLLQRGLGLQAFMAGGAPERLMRDLATYLRQPAPDETLVKAAAHYFTAPLPR